MQNIDPIKFDVRAVSFYDPEGTDLDDMLSVSGLPVRYLGKAPGFDPRIFWQLMRVVKAFRPHVLHTHLRALSYLLPTLLFYRSCKKIHTVHNLAEHEVGEGRQQLHDACFRYLDVTPVSISHEVTHSLMSRYRLEQVALVTNGIPVGAYQLEPGAGPEWRSRHNFVDSQVIFACIARMSEQKNHIGLIRSFARVASEVPEAHLLLVGTGHLLTQLAELADELQLREKVHFLGQRYDVPEILAAADVFVLASHFEGNPLSVMEAMAAGTPVVATAVGGIPELIEHENEGLLVSHGQEHALAHAMVRVARDESFRNRLAKAARAKAENLFTVEAMARAYEELYEG